MGRKRRRVVMLCLFGFALLWARHEGKMCWRILLGCFLLDHNTPFYHTAVLIERMNVRLEIVGSVCGGLQGNGCDAQHFVIRIHRILVEHKQLYIFTAKKLPFRVERS